MGLGAGGGRLDGQGGHGDGLEDLGADAVLAGQAQAQSEAGQDLRVRSPHRLPFRTAGGPFEEHARSQERHGPAQLVGIRKLGLKISARLFVGKPHLQCDAL